MANVNAKRTTLWTIVALALVLIAFGAIKLNKPKDVGGSKVEVPITELEHFKGNASAKVVLVEYSDFQCPACANFYPVVNQLYAELGDRVKFVYKHFPLRNIHANADLAARASVAAAEQGKFWEMHDKLFENQGSWAKALNAETIFTNYAGELGLDADRFRRDMRSPEVKDRVERDYQSAVGLGLGGTPTFILNGRELRIGSYEEFRNKILEAVTANP